MITVALRTTTAAAALLAGSMSRAGDTAREEAAAALIHIGATPEALAAAGISEDQRSVMLERIEACESLRLRFAAARAALARDAASHSRALENRFHGVADNDDVHAASWAEQQSRRHCLEAGGYLFQLATAGLSHDVVESLRPLRQHRPAGTRGLLSVAPTGARSIAPAHNALTESDLAARSARAQTALQTWPAHARAVAESMIVRHGPPSIASPGALMWEDAPPWKWIRVLKPPAGTGKQPQPPLLQQAIEWSWTDRSLSLLRETSLPAQAAPADNHLVAEADTEEDNLLLVRIFRAVLDRSMTVDEASVAFHRTSPGEPEVDPSPTAPPR